MAKHFASGVSDVKASKRLLAKELPLLDRVKGFLDDKQGAASAIGSLLKGLAALAV